MGYLPEHNPPEFNNAIPQWDRETLADGIEMSKVPEALLENDQYLLKEIQRQDKINAAYLEAALWQGDQPPFTQRVYPTEPSEYLGREDVTAVLFSLLEEGADEETQKAYNKAFSIVCSGIAKHDDQGLLFTVYKKPKTDLVVGLRGI